MFSVDASPCGDYKFRTSNNASTAAGMPALHARRTRPGGSSMPASVVRGHRLATLQGVAGATWLAAAIASAQGIDPDLEQIIVTGTRIARPDFESASPVVSVTTDAFVRTSSTSVDTVVSQLPQFTPDMTTSSNNPSNGGQGNLQLRGLGATSTLVLLDGRRIVPANGDGVVDVNVVPASLIESVEVISGGASAVYGSDAIAGVVNFKLKDDFDGLQFDGGWGQTDRGDGSEYSAGVTAGLSFAGERGEVYGYVGYSEREAVFQRARDFSAVTLGYAGPGAGGVGPDGSFLPQGSIFIAEGRTLAGPSQLPSQSAVDALFGTYGYGPGTVPVAGNGFTVNADGSVFSVGNGTPGSVVNYRGEQDPLLFNDRIYTYNYGPWNYLQLPLERVSAFGRASFDVGPGAQLYGQALYADYSADTALAPAPAFGLRLPVTNPFIPADLAALLATRPDPAADVTMGRRFAELGPRISSTQHDVIQLTLGSRGRFFGDWSYDAFAQVGRNDSTETQSGNVLRSKVMELAYAPDGGLAACGGLQLFGPGAVHPKCARYISAAGTNRSGFDQTVVEVSISGSALSMPAGDLKLALGAMYKRDAYAYEADPIGSVVLEDGLPDIQGFNASDDIDGSDHNTDIFLEVAVPLLRDVTAVKRLEAVIGYRHSEYESAGGADAYKAEFLYDPVQALTLRTSYQRAVRAASVFELFHPHLPVLYGSNPLDGGLLDPCTAGSPERSGPNAAQVEALCLAQGVPADLLVNFVDGDGVHIGVYGGNPDLEPEVADTLTAGIVLRSSASGPLLASMQFSLDWYRIEMEDAIVSLTAEEYLPLCFDARVNPAFNAGYEPCGYFSRDSSTGEIAGLRDLYRNTVGFDVSGVDAQFDWTFEAGPGAVAVNWLASWMESFETVSVEGLPAREEAGRIGGFVGGTLPKWKWNLNLGYSWNDLSFGGRWRHIDSMRDREIEEYEIESYDYFDLYASYAAGPGWLDGLVLRAGVENLADREPPLVPTQVQANTEPAQYDVLGRRYYLNLTYRF
jgi:iron complex outermembrane receptor protein